MTLLSLVKKYIIPIILIAVLWGLGWFIYNNFILPPVQYQKVEGKIDISRDPIQENFEGEEIKLQIEQIGEIKPNEVILVPVAKYDIVGKVIAKAFYKDEFSVIAPFDLGLIWGEAVKYYDEGQITVGLISLRERKALRSRGIQSWIKKGAPVNLIVVKISSNHLIPANENIHNAFRRIKLKDLVQIKGYLVNIIIKTDWGDATTPTSLTRDDSFGNGGSEIIYVQSLRLGNKIYK